MALLTFVKEQASVNAQQASVSAHVLAELGKVSSRVNDTSVVLDTFTKQQVSVNGYLISAHNTLHSRLEDIVAQQTRHNEAVAANFSELLAGRLYSV